MRVAISISANQIRQPDFVLKIKKTLDKTGLSANFLELEITEGALITTMDSSISSLSELSAMGVHIALDNFGAGSSSINYLRKVPWDRLKINQSFISNCNFIKSDEVIVQSIVSLAKKLNLAIVAEGVETKKQLAFLETNHCEEAQGSYFSKPVTTNELEALLQSFGNNKEKPILS